VANDSDQPNVGSVLKGIATQSATAKPACARCATPFKSFSGPLPLWCPTDEVCLCPKCIDGDIKNPSCPACFGPLKFTSFAVLVLTIVTVVVITFAAAYTATEWGVLESHGARVVAINNLRGGMTVVTTGVIQGPPGSVVLSGVLTSCGRGSQCWEWSGTNFLISEDNSSVLIDVSQLGNNVQGAPHYSPDISSGTYQSGDQVAVSGLVEVSSGNLTLVASAVAPGIADLESGTSYTLAEVVAMWSIAAAISISTASLTFVGRRRLVCSEQNAQAFRGKLGLGN